MQHVEEVSRVAASVRETAIERIVNMVRDGIATGTVTLSETDSEK